MAHGKISIIGAGFVGASIAYALTLMDYTAELVLIDATPEKAKVEILDIQQGLPFIRHARIRAGDFREVKDSDVIIITSGRNRKPHETRLEMTRDNVKTIDVVIKALKKYYNTGVIIIVSNPVDVLTYKAALWMEHRKIFGTGCMLDIARAAKCLSEYFHVSAGEVQTSVVGEHGLSQVFLWSGTLIGGLAVNEFAAKHGIPVSDAVKHEIEQKVLNMGTVIIQGKGRTHYGITTCVCKAVYAILNNRPFYTCASVPLYGEYGLNRVALSVPGVIDKQGFTLSPEKPLYPMEYEKLRQSASVIQDAIALCGD